MSAINALRLVAERRRAILRLIDAQGKEIARYEHSFHSDVDQSSLPDQPLDRGPGVRQFEKL